MRLNIRHLPQVLDEENNLLTAPYAEEVVRKAIFQMKHNKALGRDSFSQNFLDVIK
jgi:hypothetical protein